MKRTVSPATIERVAQHIENIPVFSKRAQRELSRVMRRLENEILTDPRHGPAFRQYLRLVAALSTPINRKA